MENHSYIVPSDAAGQRMDVWLASAYTAVSRTRCQQLIWEGRVLVDGVRIKPNFRLHGDEKVDLAIPDDTEIDVEPEDIPLRVMFEDEHVLVINKPPGLVIHPAPGHADGTLVNALLYHCGDSLKGIGGERRPGIVHRLDKDTSGAMVVAKTAQALTHLHDQFRDRQTRKEYLALVAGVPKPRVGHISTKIGRHPVHRKLMSAEPARGRPAESAYEVLRDYGDSALVLVRIFTGRTHQIRVHMEHIGHPLLGDTLYGRKRTTTFRDQVVPRQLLHAYHLGFAHPVSGEALFFEAPVPEDMLEWQAILDKSSPAR